MLQLFIVDRQTKSLDKERNVGSLSDFRIWTMVYKFIMFPMKSIIKYKKKKTNYYFFLMQKFDSIFETILNDNKLIKVIEKCGNRVNK